MSEPPLSPPMPPTNTYFETYFPRWKQAVDQVVYQQTNFHLNDIPDFPFADNFENGTSVDDMVSIIIADLNEMFNLDEYQNNQNHSYEP